MSMNFRSLHAAVLALISTLSVCANATEQTYTYVYQDLGTPTGKRHSVALGINDLDQIVGYAYNQLTYGEVVNGDQHATLWSGGGIFDLGTLGGTYSLAQSINNAAQIVGLSDTKDNASRHAVLWKHGRPIDLGSLGGIRNTSSASSINRIGQIVGVSSTTTYDHAAQWQHGTSLDLGVPAKGVWSTATSISNTGMAAGYSLLPGGVWATVWRDGTPTVLPSLTGGSSSMAHAVNDLGVIVGMSSDGYGTFRAVRWQGDTIKDLGSLADGSTARANAINAAGQIVGSSTDEEDATHATLWSNDQLIDLNGFLPAEAKNAGWILKEARAINRRGVIVGYAEQADTHTFHAFKLTPIRCKGLHHERNGRDGMAKLVSACTVPH